MEKIKNGLLCPICGSKVEKEDQSSLDEPYYFGYQVICNNCGFRGEFASKIKYEINLNEYIQDKNLYEISEMCIDYLDDLKLDYKLLEEDDWENGCYACEDSESCKYIKKIEDKSKRVYSVGLTYTKDNEELEQYEGLLWIYFSNYFWNENYPYRHLMKKGKNGVMLLCKNATYNKDCDEVWRFEECIKMLKKAWMEKCDDIE